MKTYKREGSPYWWAVAYVGERRVRWSTGVPLGTSQEVANRKMAEDYQKLLAKNVDGRSQELLKDACERYLKTMEASSDHRNLKTRVDKLFGVGKWSDAGIWTIPETTTVNQLNTGMLSRLKEARLAEGLKPNSVNLELKVLQRVYNLAKKHWMYAVDPNVQFTFLKVKPKTRWLSVEEEQAVLALLLPYQKAHDLSVFLLDTGVRLGEALLLPWRHVDFEKGVITVFRPKTKTSVPFSTLGMTSRVREVLERRALDNNDGPFLHMTKAIKHIRRAVDTVCNQDKEVIEIHGRATVHSFRDTFASRLIQRGMALYPVSKLLGHSSLEMTQKYAHLAEAENAMKAVSLLEPEPVVKPAHLRIVK